MEGGPDARPVLVTGAAGFVGHHLLELLVNSGKQVVGWYRPETDLSQLRADIPWTEVEMTDSMSVDAALAATLPAEIYHLAGAANVAASWTSPLDTYQSNVLGTHHLLNSVAAHVPSTRVLVSCSGTVYAPQPRPLREDDPLAPATPYAVSKLAQELVALRAWADAQVATVVVRAFNHTGPWQTPAYVAPAIARQIARIEAGYQPPVLRLGNLDPKRDLADVRDVVRAYHSLMERGAPGRVYNVCAGQEMSIRELVQLFLQRARVVVTIEQDPALLRPTDVPVIVGDHSRLVAETGWQPAYSLADIVVGLLAHWRERVTVEPHA